MIEHAEQVHYHRRHAYWNDWVGIHHLVCRLLNFENLPKYSRRPRTPETFRYSPQAS